jgi:predicted RecA/RadA family phage recombinase
MHASGEIIMIEGTCEQSTLFKLANARAVTLASGRRFYSNADVVEHRNERVRPEINIIWGAGGCARVVA